MTAPSLRRFGAREAAVPGNPLAPGLARSPGVAGVSHRRPRRDHGPAALGSRSPSSPTHSFSPSSMDMLLRVAHECSLSTYCVLDVCRSWGHRGPSPSCRREGKSGPARTAGRSVYRVPEEPRSVARGTVVQHLASCPRLHITQPLGTTGPHGRAHGALRGLGSAPCPLCLGKACLPEGGGQGLCCPAIDNSAPCPLLLPPRCWPSLPGGRVGRCGVCSWGRPGWTPTPRLVRPGPGVQARAVHRNEATFPEHLRGA